MVWYGCGPLVDGPNLAVRYRIGPLTDGPIFAVRYGSGQFFEAHNDKPVYVVLLTYGRPFNSLNVRPYYPGPLLLLQRLKKQLQKCMLLRANGVLIMAC